MPMAPRSKSISKKHIQLLNQQIDRLQADASPLTIRGEWADVQPQFSRDHLTMLAMAARLNALRMGTARPDPDFVARLRQSVLDRAAAADGP